MNFKRMLAFALVLTGAIGLFAFTSNDEAINLKSKSFAAPCIMKITNNTNDFQGMSVNSYNVYAYANSTVSRGCSCTGYVELLGLGPVSWQLIDNSPASPTYLQPLDNGSLSGLFDIDYFNF